MQAELQIRDIQCRDITSFDTVIDYLYKIRSLLLVYQKVH